MKLLVISDLHIADNENLGTFGWECEEFIAQMEEVQKAQFIDKVILNGDVFDLYKSNYHEIVSKKKKLVEYFKRIGSVFIRGNHDFALGFGQDCFGLVNSKGEKIHIEHGHKGDFVNGTRLGRFMGFSFYVVLKVVSQLSITRKVYFKCMEHDEGFRGHGKYNSYKYLRYAVKLLHKYDLVILGHTHKIEIHDTYWLNNKKRYINTGSCSFGRFQGVIIDTETLAHSIIKIDPTKRIAVSPIIRSQVRKPRKPSYIQDGTLVPA